MDKAYFRKLRPLLHALVIGVCAGAFVSCSMEDDNGPCPVTTEQPVVMHIGAQQPPAVRAEEDAARGENIHSLWVFLVDAGNKVEWKLEVDNLDDVKDYYSDPVENLTTGAKTLYAFANFDAYLTPGDALYNEALAKLLALEKGAAFNADGIMIDDPAANISLGDVNKRIPMSGKAAVTMAVNTSEIGVGMDRLVSKVRLAIKPADSNVTATGLVMSGFADKVLLLEGSGTPSGIVCNKSKTFSNLGEITAAEGMTLADFYVNATDRSADGGFGVELTTTQYSGMTYSATTTRDNLPRNSIYPLTLTFSDYIIELEPLAWRAPIGMEPIEYEIDADGNYVIQMLETTSRFQITAKSLLKGASAVSGVTWQWAWDAQNGLDVSATAGEVEGHFSAISGRKYTLRLNASWTAGGKAYNRTYNVIINVVSRLSKAMRSSGDGAAWLSPETVNLRLR